MSTTSSQLASSRIWSDDVQLPWLNKTSKLPQEVITKILRRLPVKSLLRFRRVSKIWHSLIDSPTFVKKHLKKSIACNPDSGLIVRGCNLQVCLANLDPLNETTTAIEVYHPLVHGAKFVGSCNDLVCWLKEEIDVMLWNPSTRKCKMLPRAPVEFPHSFSRIELSLCGFGYDQEGDDYKVVKIAQCFRKELSCTMVVVYSLKNNSWRRVQDIPHRIRFAGKFGMFAGGAVHWLAISNPVNCSRVIVAFDLGAENYRELPFPRVGVINKTFCASKFNSVSVVVVGERLCLLDNYPSSRTDMWLLNSYCMESSWTRLCSVEQSGLKLSSFVRPVALTKGCKKVLLEGDGKKLVWYDLETKIVENVNIHGIPLVFDSHAFTESLVQLTEDSKSDGMELPKSQDKKEKKQEQKKNETKFLSKGFKLVL